MGRRSLIGTPLRRHRPTVIIFLDFDGVLHDIGCASKDLFCHEPRFSAVLRDHPDIEVVASSDWRKDAGSVAELMANFDLDVRRRFVGLTGIESDATEPRQRERECWQWLCAHGREHERWLALDDWPENFGPDLPGAGAVLLIVKTRLNHASKDNDSVQE
jgi:hypothetical protein